MRSSNCLLNLSLSSRHFFTSGSSVSLYFICSRNSKSSGSSSSYLILRLRCSRLRKPCTVRVKLLVGLFHYNKTSTISWLSSPVSRGCSLSSDWLRSPIADERTRHSVLHMDLWFVDENSPLYMNKLFVSQQYVRDGSVDCMALTEGDSDVLVVAPNFRISEPISINDDWRNYFEWQVWTCYNYTIDLTAVPISKMTPLLSVMLFQCGLT